MPEWLHERARHLLAKNPDMPKSEAFAIATQQSHAGGHSPKGYGTAEGKRVARAKFDTPKDDVQAANPGHLSTPYLKAAGVVYKFPTPRLGRLAELSKKTAGIRVDYDVHFKPVASQTHDEWLVGMFKRDGSFHVPGMLDHVSPLGKYGMAGFIDELEKISGVLDTVKKVLTTPIEGTPELIPHGALEAIKRLGSSAPAAVAKKPPVDWRAARAAAFR